MKPLVEAVAAKAMEANTRITVASGSATRTNLIEGIIKITTARILETVLKRGEIAGCATASKINVDVIIPTPQSFIMSGSMFQSISVFWMVMTIVSCQGPLKGKGLLSDRLEEEALK